MNEVIILLIIDLDIFIKIKVFLIRILISFTASLYQGKLSFLKGLYFNWKVDHALYDK